MKRLILATLILTGCSSMAPATGLQVDGEQEPWQITAKHDDYIPGGRITIAINGEQIIQERLPTFGRQATFNGSYRNRKVRVACQQISSFMGFLYDVQCTVTVNDRHTTTLQLN